MGWLLQREWVAPLLVLGLSLLLLLRFDQAQRGELQTSRDRAAADAKESAARLSDAIGNVISTRIGALRTASLELTRVSDAVSERTFFAALDSATSGLDGLTAISVVRPNGDVRQGTGALIGQERGLDIFSDSVVRAPYQRALFEKRVTASAVVEVTSGRRVFVFDPVLAPDSTVQAVVVGELEPNLVVRSALNPTQEDELGSGVYAVYGPNGTPITTEQFPRGWETIEQTVQVADPDTTDNWRLRWAYPPVN